MENDNIYLLRLQLYSVSNCRIFWAVAFMLAVATAAYFITLLYRKWDESPVIVSVGAKATQLISIPFPAVTICNMNKARRSIAKEILNSKYVYNISFCNKGLILIMCKHTTKAFKRKTNLTFSTPSVLIYFWQESFLHPDYIYQFKFEFHCFKYFLTEVILLLEQRLASLQN
jgi:hypothetical protein